MDGVIQIFTHRGTTRIPEFTAFADGGNFATGRGGAELSGLLGRFDYSAGVSDLETAGPGPERCISQPNALRKFRLALFGHRASQPWLARQRQRGGHARARRSCSRPNLTDTHRSAQFQRRPACRVCNGLALAPSGERHRTLFSRIQFRSVFSALLSIQPRRFRGAVHISRSRDSASPPATNMKSKTDFISFTSALHARRNNQAGFLDARWQPVARLTLNAGARAEDNADFGTRVVPRAGASYALRIAQGAFGDTRLHASYGQGIVEPQIRPILRHRSLFSRQSQSVSRTEPDGSCGSRAKTRFRPRARHRGLFRQPVSQHHQLSECRAVAACLAIGAPFGAGTYFNTNLARARGANFSGEARITRWLSASANYTYDSTRTLSAPTDPADLDPNYLPGSRLLRRPVNSGNVMLNAAFRRMNWNLSGYFTGQRYDYNFPGQIIESGLRALRSCGDPTTSRTASAFTAASPISPTSNIRRCYGYPGAGARVSHRREIHHAP